MEVPVSTYKKKHNSDLIPVILQQYKNETFYSNIKLFHIGLNPQVHKKV